jgi:hypothetical protein
MILVIILVFIAVVTLAVVFGVAISRGLRARPRSGQAMQIEPLDVDAFRNLVNPAEDAYLRSRLTGGEFRTARRARLRTLAAYVQAAGRNAAVLIVVSEAAMASPDSQTVEAARQLVNQALLLRRNAFFALVRVYLALAWPSASIATISILEAYGEMSSSAMLLGRLRNPAVPVRV